MPQVRVVPHDQRGQFAKLLNLDSANDAMAAYYALHHPANRTTLYGYFANDGSPLGFMAVARTGVDLFRPVAVPFVAQPVALESLLREAISPGWPVLIYLPAEQGSWIEGAFEVSQACLLDLMRLDPRFFEPVINVLVLETLSPQGWPRFEIQSRDVLHAASGVNWIGDRFAEIYAEATPEGQARNFRRSVIASIVQRLLADGRLPLYRVEENDAPAQLEAVGLGFRRTGERTLMAQVLRREKSQA